MKRKIECVEEFHRIYKLGNSEKPIGKLKDGLENYQLSDMAATLINWHDEFLQKEADYSKSFYDDAQDFLNKKFDERFLNKHKSKLKM